MSGVLLRKLMKVARHAYNAYVEEEDNDAQPVSEYGLCEDPAFKSGKCRPRQKQSTQVVAGRKMDRHLLLISLNMREPG
jgi:hypothetical protein